MKTDNTPIRKTILPYMNGKSGGKTTALVHFAARLKARQHKIQLIEGDLATMGLSNFHDSPVYDVTKHDEMRRLMADVRLSETTLYGVDTPAASTKDLLSLWCPLSTTQYVEETGIKITPVVTMNSHADSIFQAQIICAHFAQTDADIVLALIHSPSDVTSDYQNSEIRNILETKLAAKKAIVISLPHCKNERALRTLFQTGKDALSVQSQPCSVMEPFDKTDLLQWYETMSLEFDRLLDFVCPGHEKIPTPQRMPSADQLNDMASLKLRKRKDLAGGAAA